LDPPIIALWMNIEKIIIHDDIENDVDNVDQSGAFPKLECLPEYCPS
jgi:hypothetical protein